MKFLFFFPQTHMALNALLAIILAGWYGSKQGTKAQMACVIAALVPDIPIITQIGVNLFQHHHLMRSTLVSEAGRGTTHSLLVWGLIGLITWGIAKKFCWTKEETIGIVYFLIGIAFHIVIDAMTHGVGENSQGSGYLGEILGICDYVPRTGFFPLWWENVIGAASLIAWHVVYRRRNRAAKMEKQSA